MQSQQKRVKWSRGETAEALEERTDTGITQASVEYMENCIPDIYGNISRRPGLKLIPFADNYVASNASYPFFSTNNLVKIIPFFIAENDYILVGIYQTPDRYRMLRIKNNECVYMYAPAIAWSYGFLNKITSYAQQNNYLIISDGGRTYKLSVEFPNGIDSPEFTPIWEAWSYTGGWYAPNGTSTQEVSDTILPGLNISGNFSTYIYVNPDGTSTTYSMTTTGLNNQQGLNLISSVIPVGSIVQLPNIGAYFRVEGYFEETMGIIFSDTTFSAVVNNSSIPSQGHVAVINAGGLATGVVGHYYNGTLQETVSVPSGKTVVVKNSASSTGYSRCGWVKISIGGHSASSWSGWFESSVPSTGVKMYGSLLTPIVDESATDKSVNVEYGYVSLTPSAFSAIGATSSVYPLPTKFCFSEQRLWGAEWSVSSTESYPIIIGSQIARYNDFKNDYNQDNEAITLDIVTQRKEKILHLIDYNGLKIFTDSFEYAYDSTGVTKQSAHGSLESCDPIIFGSLCLFADRTGGQIQAMQYEFQNNLFDSACINQLAPEDLIWKPTSLSSLEDKINNTGKYLFVMNDKTGGAPDIAVCNFVPGNQANIWSRWNFQKSNDPYEYLQIPGKKRVYDIITVDDKAVFLIYVNTIRDRDGFPSGYIVPAELDFNAKGDLEGTVSTDGLVAGSGRVFLGSAAGFSFTVRNSPEVMVFSDGEYMFTTTTDNTGILNRSIDGLSNITVALPIHSTIVSHPIDVGGKTKSVMKRVGKVQMSVHDTNPGAININNKTGYMNPRQDHICFYGVSGFKDELKYTITNKNGAIFHLESLLMNIEYGTLDS